MGAAYAQEYTGSSLKVVDPTLLPTVFSTSTAYQLWGQLGAPALATSTASNFGLQAGFLYYPLVTTPTLSASAGDSQVSLSWANSIGYLGWTVGGYTLGHASLSGGPYTYTSVGNVTSAIKTGLSNGTTYYFVLRVQDNLSNFIATSSEVSSTPVASGGGGGGGSGGGGGGSVAVTGVHLLGRAYPLSHVTLLKDGQISTETVAGPDARFDITLTGLTAGSYNFALYGTDQAGRRSSLFTFPTTVTYGVLTEISGIFLAPTIALDKSAVKQGDNLAIFGQTTPTSTVTISLHSPVETFVQTPSDATGIYLYNLDTSPLERGDHLAKSKAARANELSAFGPAVVFAVGDSNVPFNAGACPPRADLNDDCRVNLIDFSIAAYWYRRPLTPAFAAREKVKLSGDGKVDLVDFSIMAYFWSG